MSKHSSLKTVTPGKAEQASSAELVMQAIIRIRIPLIVISVLVLAAILIGFTLQYVREARMEASAELVTQLDSSYQSWVAAEGEDTAEEHYEEFLTAYEEAVDNYSDMYAGLFARFLSAQIDFANQDYSAAADAFLEIAATDRDSHLVAMSAMNAGVAYEESGDVNAAQTAYENYLDSFSETSPETPRVLFSLGRISEETDIQASIEWYERLTDTYPNSEWTNLAESRIIFLRSVEE